MLQKNDLILVQRGSLGKVAEINKEIGLATINPSMILIRSKNTDSHFLWYQFQSKRFQNLIEQIKQSTAVPMISQENVKNFKVILPTNDEQRSIGKFLDENILKIDSLIFNTKSQIRLNLEYYQSMINSLLTGKINVN